MENVMGYNMKIDNAEMAIHQVCLYRPTSTIFYDEFISEFEHQSNKHHIIWWISV